MQRDTADIRPTTAQTVAALQVVGDEIGTPVAFYWAGSFFFKLDDGWNLAIREDSAGRFRLAACTGLREAATMWTFAHDHLRLRDLVRGLRLEIAALAA